MIVNFRVTQEEKQLLDNRIELSGLSRQEFVIKSCLHQKITTVGNVKTFEAIKKQMAVIDKHILSITKSEQLDLEVLESLRMVLEMLDGLEKKE